MDPPASPARPGPVRAGEAKPMAGRFLDLNIRDSFMSPRPCTGFAGPCSLLAQNPLSSEGGLDAVAAGPKGRILGEEISLLIFLPRDLHIGF